MAGRGPAPKDPAKRARRNADPVPLRSVVVEPDTQPELPTVMVEQDGELVEYVWPAVTQQWWRMWATHPVSRDFTALEWSFLADTARVHAAFWSGDTKAAAELRLRVAKFGATPDDRARLRLVFAMGSDEQVRSTVQADKAKTAYSGLRAI